MTCGIQITFLVYHYTFDNIYVCEWTLFLWQGMSTKKIMSLYEKEDEVCEQILNLYIFMNKYGNIAEVDMHIWKP